ncbi:hypothetical protein BKA67DRAFT_662799 [Truncatella angustata]|uniref:Uncharacterized protein n=1 Tax=Truncatella angustata TaxID=152316 RepID=A0A9P8UDR9_9PEZI|nr:uncharacterized protein BKA67DRAFT_662799 [Truncatella angustata]KAH6648068.1 hypothetical protein BKA67DRAFT_662799 [Truncatella angustata]
MPNQVLHLLDLPNEILLNIAHWCHIQPRETKRVTSLIPTTDFRKEDCSVNVGGGLDSLSRVNKCLWNILRLVVFSRLNIKCDEDKLGIHLTTLLQNGTISHSARTLCIVTEISNNPRTKYAVQHSSDVRAESKGRKCAVLPISVLEIIPGLIDLRVDIEMCFTEPWLLTYFRQCAIQINLRLDQLEGLFLGKSTWVGATNSVDGDMSFLVSICPNIERASLPFVQRRPRVENFVPFGNLKNLKDVQFDMGVDRVSYSGEWNEISVLGQYVIPPTLIIASNSTSEITDIFPRSHRHYLPGKFFSNVRSLALILGRLAKLEFLALTSPILVNIESREAAARSEVFENNPACQATGWPRIMQVSG